MPNYYFLPKTSMIFCLVILAFIQVNFNGLKLENDLV